MKGRKYLVTGSTIILLLVVAATVVYTKAVSGVPQDGAEAHRRNGNRHAG